MINEIMSDMLLQLFWVIAIQELRSASGNKALVQHADQSVGVVQIKWHRGADLDDVMKRSVGAEEDGLFAHSIYNQLGFFPRRLERIAVAHQFNPEKET